MKGSREKRAVKRFISPIKKAPAIPTLVAEQILELIRKGRLKPGDRLPSEHEMTMRFRISRISLREAMKLLEARGYIESRRRRGKFIRIPQDAPKSTIEDLLAADQQKIWELLCVRRILDSEAVRLACAHATARDVQRLRKILDRALAIGPERVLDDIEEGGRLYTEFFDTILASTRNATFAHIRRSINTILVGAFPYSRKKLSTIQGSSRVIVSQLHEIVEGIASKDASRACRAVEEHIDYLKRSLKKAMQAS